MRLAVFAFTRRGCEQALKVRDVLRERTEICRLFTMKKFELPGFEAYEPPLADFVKPIFAWADQLIFVGSTGMAIRAIAPWVRDKKTDPGVIVMDEGGQFVISLLSGHIGGANSLTRILADRLGAIPVVTTATDVNGKFSVDDWAARKGLTIADMKAAKAVSAAILEGDVPLASDFPIPGGLPNGVVLGDRGSVGIYIGYGEKKPFDTTLQLIPPVLQLGIGCRKGIPMENVEKAVIAVLEANHLPRAAVCGAASIDIKAQEEGLLAFCEKWNLPIQFYSAEELRQVPGDFPASEFVKSITGVDNVCQRSAMLGADRVIVNKTAMDGVTVSVAEKYWEVVF